MSYEERQIAAIVHGRYLIDGGSSSEDGRPLLVGFHGYGENAKDHLEQLRQIPGVDGWVVCSVAALHPFYTRAGAVVGCWMTKLNRDQAIDDNVRYTAGVVSKIRREERTSDVLVMAGFSQGVAMAYRTALRCGFPCHGLLALAGDVPPEIVEAQTLPFPRILLGRGTQDEWYTEEKMTKDLAVLEEKGAEVTRCVFEAGHVWTAEYFAAAGDFLARIHAVA